MDLTLPLDALPPDASPLDILAAAPAYTIHAPAQQSAPLVLASPHSGRNYPAEFLAASRLDATGLRRSEDSFVDELFADAPRFGVPLLAATFPRAWCDPNRERWELDASMFADELPAYVNRTSARVGAGLGTIARIVASGEPIYRRKLRFSEAEQRVRACWDPYHEALANLITETRKRFKVCLLLDCHSMPATGPNGPDMVLGDLHGTTCAPQVTRTVETMLTGMGYQVRRNDPYAGGYVTRHYGRPREGVHALQLEIARPLYMDEARIEHGPHFTALRDHLSLLIARLVAAGVDPLRQP